tara:strand:- start:38535 stop:39104 length:570 start_codon:yes stop_codon:yes gene_type:complete
MIEEFLLWVQLLSQAAQNQQVLVNQSQSNVIFIAYIITIRKSYLFGSAFLFSLIVSISELIPSNLPSDLHGLVFYCATLLTWLSVASLHIRQTSSKNTLICCAIMILFLLTMAWDSYINAYTETFIWRNYENIILLIHVCIIISLYKPRAIIDGLVDKFINAVNLLRNNYACLYFWYTIKNWQINKRLL